MKGVGKTVMVGTKLEEFGAEVLGVMRDVSPGRDMVLCRLTGCNLEHAGHHPGDERQPDLHRRQALGRGGVRLGVRQGPDRRGHAVPADGPVRPGQRPADRRRGRRTGGADEGSTRRRVSIVPELDGARRGRSLAGSTVGSAACRSRAGRLAGMTPIATPLAATGLQPAAPCRFLETRLRPLGMAPMAGGAAPEHVDPRGGGPAARARVPR